MIALVMILLGKSSCAQIDSTVSPILFSRIEAINIAEFVVECEILEIENENYRIWVDNQQEKIGILERDNSSQKAVIRTLTAKLNDEKNKRKKARKSRIIWAIGGAAIGVITYRYLTE